jgi:putative transposase
MFLLQRVGTTAIRAMKKKRHTPEEIAAKLREADNMVAQGKLHGDVARALGVSIMTYHRWRKARAATPEQSPTAPERTAPAPSESPASARISDLQLENSRLRRLVTDLLLEKVELEEALQSSKPDRSSSRKVPK